MNLIMDALAVAWKDLKVLFKDKGALAVLLLMPLLLAVIFNAPQMSAASLSDPEAEDAPVIKAYWANEDTGPYGAQVVEALGGVKMLDGEEVETADRADELIADGDAAAAIVIPADFSKKIAANEPTTVRIIKDPTQQDAARIVAGISNAVLDELGTMAEIQYGIRAVLHDSGVLEGADLELRQAAEAQTMGVIWTQVQEMRQNPLITVSSENLAGEEVTGEWNPFSVAMPQFATMFAFFLVAFMAEKLLEEKEAGTFRRLMASPMHRGCVIAGKMLAYMVIVFLQVLLLFAVGALFFEMPLGGSPDGLLLLTLVLALAATALGMLIGTLARTSQQAGTIGVVLGMVLMVAGGAIALGSLPFRSEGLMFYVSQLTPHAHAIDGYMKLMSEGAGLPQVLSNITILAAFAVGAFVIAMWRVKFVE
jgi:ABC-2 type transport system permease protein